jgi:hypothetical protein
MAEQGSRGTGWALVIGAAILYLLASTLRLDLELEAEQNWKGKAATAREAASPVPQRTRHRVYARVDRQIGKRNVEDRIIR